MSEFDPPGGGSRRRGDHGRQSVESVIGRGAMCQGQIFTEFCIASKGSKAELAQTRMPVWSATKRPMILTVGFLDRKIVDASNSKAGKPVLIVLPILISVGTEPVAAVVVPLIGEAYRDAVVAESP